MKTVLSLLTASDHPTRWTLRELKTALHASGCTLEVYNRVDRELTELVRDRVVNVEQFPGEPAMYFLPPLN